MFTASHGSFQKLQGGSPLRTFLQAFLFLSHTQQSITPTPSLRLSLLIHLPISRSAHHTPHAHHNYDSRSIASFRLHIPRKDFRSKMPGSKGGKSGKKPAKRSEKNETNPPLNRPDSPMDNARNNTAGQSHSQTNSATAHTTSNSSLSMSAHNSLSCREPPISVSHPFSEWI
ncbi:hypothetical protein P154DRAFT_523157 [Amniculicola lignicola CBS 123094]|uniref:Uncharacterized protein n=1 Tax=Amniculicola lignicola CBS 123094 TaxID=1392246 RepID=A0A6A5WCK0_9PLEO|nr:hypothetical protein P154DRAFT_523157 [Amniculicola lignicola CBS 123094]